MSPSPERDGFAASIIRLYLGFYQFRKLRRPPKCSGGLSGVLQDWEDESTAAGVSQMPDKQRMLGGCALQIRGFSDLA